MGTGINLFRLLHGLMLLTMKDESTTGSFYLCNSFHVFSVLMISNHICTRMHLHAITICTDSMIMDMCPHLLLIAICF